MYLRGLQSRHHLNGKLGLRMAVWMQTKVRVRAWAVA